MSKGINGTPLFISMSYVNSVYYNFRPIYTEFPGHDRLFIVEIHSPFPMQMIQLCQIVLLSLLRLFQRNYFIMNSNSMPIIIDSSKMSI